MNTKHAALFAVALVIFPVVAQSQTQTGPAVPAGVAFFSDGYSAKFVRSASGIVNETNRTLPSGIPDTLSVQFRPWGVKTPNPTCDPVGLVDHFGPWGTTEPSLLPFFPLGTFYNVCFYYVPKVVAGTFCFQASYGAAVQPFNACVILAAKQLDSEGDGSGSFSYTDPNGTFVVAVSYVKAVGNVAYFAGATTYSDFPGIDVGTWFYEVATDNGNPGVGLDTLAGSNFGTSGQAQAQGCVQTPGSCPNQTAALAILSGDIHIQ